MSGFLGKIASKTAAATRALRDDKSGVAAVEFVFIAPLIITLWLGTIEISLAIDVNKKVGRAASMVGDLVAQSDKLTVNEINDIIRIGAAVLQPYQTDKPKITVSELFVDPSQATKVVWSRSGKDNTFTYGIAPNTPVTDLPVNLRIANTHLIKVQTELQYYPLTSSSYSLRSAFRMSETYYLRPRQSDTVDCIGGGC